MTDPSTGPQSVTVWAPGSQRPGYIYVAREPNGLVKIGFSIDPDRRMRDLEPTVGTCELLATMPGTLRDERALHKRYEDRQVFGEWFGFLDDELPDVIATCQADCS